MDEQRAAQLLGSPERRATFRDFEIRSKGIHTFLVRGYACVTDFAYDVYGGPEKGGWTETVRKGAFDTTLAAKPDVSFLINHEGMPLARTKSGTLTLRADSTGLESEAEVDRRDPFGQALEVKMERGDLDQMSFGFRVTRQEWDDTYTDRGIVEVNLDHGDVSIVNIPANPATSMSIVTARSALAVLGEMEMAELRTQLGDISPDELRVAQNRLGELVQQLSPATGPLDSRPPASTVEVDVVPVLREATREGLATVARELLGALLGDEAGEERLEQVLATLRTLGQPQVIEITDPQGDTVARVAEDGTAEFSEVVVEDEDRTEQPAAGRSTRSVSLLRELYDVA